MPLSQEATALIAKLGVLHERAAHGDQEVIHFLKSLKTRALNGDPKAKRIHNTLAVIHWQKQKGGDYDRCEAYYNRLKAGDPKAQAKLQLLLQRVRAGDPDAKQLFSVLKSIHHKWKSSAFIDGPGAPRVGGYGLPQEHRPGIIIGGTDFHPQQGHGGGYPMNRFSALQGRSITIHRPPVGYAGPRPGPRVSGVTNVQPLTPQALANLLALMAQVRAMPLSSVAARVLQNLQPQTTQSTARSTVPPATRLSTVQAPSGIKLTSALSHAVVLEPPICVQARAAVARKSPVAMALVAQCAALGYKIPYNPADFPAMPAPDPSAQKILGRITLKR